MCDRISHSISDAQPRVAKARLDLPTSSNPIVEARFGDIAPDWVKNQGWRMLSVFAIVPSSILSIIAQVSVLYGLIQSEGGGWFALFAAVGPILDSFSWSSHGSKGGVAHAPCNVSCH